MEEEEEDKNTGVIKPISHVITQTSLYYQQVRRQE